MQWDFPYASQRMPVMARNIVSASQPLAAQAGIQMLQQGGNAVDAALATAIALTVVEPNMNGIGSDAFCILWDGNKLHGLNASGRAPAAWTPQRFARYETMPLTGWDTVTVPGCVSAWVALSEKFGKLKFEQLFGPAIDYAERGYPVPPIVAHNWQAQAAKYTECPDYAAAFMPGGRTPQPGEIFRFPDQARTLRLIAESKGRAYYQGELAEKIVAHAKAGGGAMKMEDLASHRADWVEPLAQDYHGHTLHEIPPNGQGIAALVMLGILQHADVRRHAVDSVDSLHLQIEAMKLAFADIYRYVSDPASMEFDPQQLLSPEYLAARAKLIDPKRAQFPQCGAPAGGSETIYLSTADAGGMMVSYIQSNYMGFGSGIVVPGTGISLQNRGSGFSLQAGHPNQVGPRKRPFHTIIPGFLTKNRAPLMSFGVMGGLMQAQGHAQMVVRMVDYQQNPQAASDAPRWYVSPEQGVYFEETFDPKLIAQLEARGHQRKEPPMFGFGGAQLIYRLQDGYVAGSDHRKDGHAVGF